MRRRFVSAALVQGKSSFKKLKGCVSSSELRAKMCKAGSSSNDAVQLQLLQQQQQQQQHQQQHRQQRSHPLLQSPHQPSVPPSAAAAAAAAAAADVAAALHGPIIIPRLALGNLVKGGGSHMQSDKLLPPPPAPLTSIDIILGRGSAAHPIQVHALDAPHVTSHMRHITSHHICVTSHHICVTSHHITSHHISHHIT